MINKSFFAVMLVLIMVCALKSQMQWQEIPSPSEHLLRFNKVQGYEKKLFWDDSGTAWHVENHEKVWTDSRGALQYVYSYMQDSSIVQLSILKDYSSLVTLIRHNSVVFEDTLAGVPLTFIGPLKDKGFFITGDWGTFFLWEEGKFIRKPVPFTNHVTTAHVTSDGNLWLAVRQEGLFYWNHEAWKHYPVADYIGTDISQIIVKDDSLAGFLARDGKKYYRKGEIFKQGMTLPPAEAWFGEGKSELWLFYGARGYFLEYFKGTYRRVPVSPNVLVLYAALFSDSLSLLTLSDNTLLQGTYTNELVFRELSGNYSFTGGRFEETKDALILDINGNGLKDILLLNKNEKANLRLYAQIDSMEFMDATLNSGLASYHHVVQVIPGDMNGDGYGDLVLLARENSSYIIYTLLYERDYNYREQHAVTLLDTLFIRIDQIQLYDMDADNIPDLLLTGHYGQDNRRGELIWLEGHRYSSWGKPTPVPSTKFWNNYIQIADLDLNGNDDLILGTDWETDRIVSDFLTSPRIIELPKVSRTRKLLLGDLNKDGLPDIIRHNQFSIDIFINHGNQTFVDATQRVFEEDPPDNVNDMELSDLNCDGYPDLLVATVNDSNRLWINNSGKSFAEKTVETNFSIPGALGFRTDDLDYDGAPDIFGLGKSYNILWLNQFNGPAPSRIKWFGTGADWNIPALLLKNDSVNEKNEYWIQPTTLTTQVSVYDKGKKRGSVSTKVWNKQTFTLTPGKTTQIYNPSKEIYFFKKWFQKGIYLFHRPMVYCYSGSFLFMLLILMIALKMGKQKLHWSATFQQAMIILNLTVFWVLMVLLSDQSSLIRFAVPPVIILVLNSLPHLTISPLLKKIHTQDLPSRRYALLQQLMVFTHGEWAMSNLNGLILHLRNFPEKKICNDRYVKILTERINMYLNLTSQKLSQIVEKGIKTDIQPDMFDKVRETNLIIITELKNLKKNNFSGQKADVQETVTELESLKMWVGDVKQATFRYFSCDAKKVIRQLVEDKKEEFDQSGIHILVTGLEQECASVLIPAYELADILDNLLQNANKALAKTDDPVKEVILAMKKVGHQCSITIADSGINVSSDSRQKIFTMAYSTWGGSGKGLAMSARIADMYGGHLYLSDSSPLGGAAFVLNLYLA